MLTIENIEKIKQYSYDVHWSCDKIGVDEDRYIFMLDRKDISGRLIDFCRIDLSRIPEYQLTGYKDGMLYAIYFNTEKTNHILTKSFLSDLNNLVNTFTKILSDYAQNKQL